MTKTNLSRGKASAPVSLRLSVEEMQELKQAAKGQTLSAHIRSRLFGGAETSCCDTRLSPQTRQKLLAQILSKLGESDLGDSLLDISQAAKIGTLPLTPDVTAEINAAIFQIEAMRKLLLKALGTRQKEGQL